MKQTKANPHHQPADLVIVVSNDQLVVIRANGSLTYAFLRINGIGYSEEDRLAQILQGVFRAQKPRRVLLSVSRSSSYEKTIGPTIDILEDLCAEHTTPLIWIPDVFELADQASKRLAIRGDKPSYLRSVRPRADVGEQQLSLR